jgi:hypothetical protein
VFYERQQRLTGKRLEEKFNGFELHHILRQDIEAADALA